MPENPKVHPVVDMEDPPSRPPPPPPVGAVTTKKQADGPSGPPPQLVPMARPPPLLPPPRPPKRSTSCCCRCICWTFCLMFTLIVAIVITGVVLYVVFQPKAPTYTVDSLRITDLRLNADLSLYARFLVRITATNPNDNIGIYYDKGGQLSVWYTQTELCRGPIPGFYQGHHNRTALEVALTGQNQYGSALLGAIQQQQQTGKVPLQLKVDAPVALKLAALKLNRVRVLVRCDLVVDSFSSGSSSLSIRTSNCKVGLKL